MHKLVKYKVRLLALFSVVLLVPSFSHAQTATGETLMLDLPRQSQHAMVSQRIGITDISVNYHRPLAKGRQIWGKVVPYGQVWRAGANENTTITFTDPVTIEGQPLDKGTYGLHMIPGENQWTVIFSKNSKDWGSFTYKQEEDALRVNVKPQTADAYDALAYDFDEVKPDSAVVTMRWDKVSIQAEERYDNLFNKSRILEALGRKEDATAFRTKALDKANALQLYVYGRQLQGDKKQEEALTIFRSNAKKFPDYWTSHLGLARVYSAQGDFDNAVKEVKLSLTGAPDANKNALETYAKRLQAKEDINK